MKKYNYFDDEADEIEEVKKSNSKKPGKIDLSTIINKFKKIEATVHEEAEEDIEVVEKFPLLRSAVIKGLWIAGAILIAIIMAVSFSVSLNSKNKKAEQFNKDAGNVCINYIKSTVRLNGRLLTKQSTVKTKPSLPVFAIACELMLPNASIFALTSSVVISAFDFLKQESSIVSNLSFIILPFIE